MKVDFKTLISNLNYKHGSSSPVMKECDVYGDTFIKTGSINKHEHYNFKTPGLFGMGAKDLNSMEVFERLEKGKVVVVEEDVTLKGTYAKSEEVPYPEYHYGSHVLENQRVTTSLKSLEDFEAFVNVETGAEPKSEKEKLAQALENIEYNKTPENNNFYEILGKNGKPVSTTEAIRRLEKNEPVQLRERELLILSKTGFFTAYNLKRDYNEIETIEAIETTPTDKTVTFNSIDELKSFISQNNNTPSEGKTDIIKLITELNKESSAEIIDKCTVSGDFDVTVENLTKKEKYTFKTPGLFGLGAKDLNSHEIIKRLEKGKKVVVEENVRIRGLYSEITKQPFHHIHTIDEKTVKTSLTSLEDLETYGKIETGAEAKTDEEKLGQLLEKMEYVKSPDSNNIYDLIASDGKSISTTEAIKRLKNNEGVELQEKEMWSVTKSETILTPYNGHETRKYKDVDTKPSGESVTFKSLDDLKEFFSGNNNE